jgi:hypothetical protein
MVVQHAKPTVNKVRPDDENYAFALLDDHGMTRDPFMDVYRKGKELPVRCCSVHTWYITACKWDDCVNYN